MASVAFSALIPRSCTSQHVKIYKKQQYARRLSCLSVCIKLENHAVADRERVTEKLGELKQHKQVGAPSDSTIRLKGKAVYVMSTHNPDNRVFEDARWNNGTWDLNMFVKAGKMDWESVIVAEARRRKFLERYPEAATNTAPVTFRSSIIPWWAWILRSHLPEAELLNGRAAMVGFFTAYLVDVLTQLDMVGQSGNFICKAGLFVTIIGVILFRRSDDANYLQKLVDEATFYDKQWQATWQDERAKGSLSEQQK